MPDYLPAWLILAIIAPAVGSFLGVLVVRLPQGRGIVSGHSRCEHCQHVLGPRDLLPVASWLWLNGKCRYCGASIGTLYPAIELAALAIVAWAATVIGDGVLVASCILGWILLALTVTDWRDYLLPDLLTLFLLLAGFGIIYLINPEQFLDHIIGAGVGFAGFAILAWAYRVLRGREGLGLGDAKLLGGIGAWVAWQGLASVILIAAALGLLVALARSLMGARLNITDRVPFGAFLAGGAWLVWLYGPLILG